MASTTIMRINGEYMSYTLVRARWRREGRWLGLSRAIDDSRDSCYTRNSVNIGSCWLYGDVEDDR